MTESTEGWVRGTEYSGELLTYELFWRDLSPWLEERGYVLRPRYRIGWTPSWTGTDKIYWDCEDGVRPRTWQTLDGVRTSDGTVVTFKVVSTKDHPLEVEIAQMFSAEPLASDPHNHCVPIYEVLRHPSKADTVLLVMPLLRAFNNPLIQTIGEAVEFFRQVFQGLCFMHEHHVAHRDCMDLNIMMDPKPLFPKLYHPQEPRYSYDFRTSAKHSTRTSRPVKYFFIDFGLSRQYDPKDGRPREDPIRGGDKTVPEFLRSNDPCDPFPTDVYYLGNMIREDFLQVFHGLEFMYPLISQMVHDDPIRRPTMAQVVTTFNVQRQTLGYWKLRSRLVRRDEFWIMRIFRVVRHVFRTIGYIIARRSPIPTP